MGFKRIQNKIYIKWCFVYKKNTYRKRMLYLYKGKINILDEFKYEIKIIKIAINLNKKLNRL